MKILVYQMGLIMFNKFKIILNLSLKNMKLLQMKILPNNIKNRIVVNTILVHCNIVQNNYQQASKVLYTFVPDKSFDRLINIHPSSLIELKITDAEFNFIDVWFADQENRPLEIEDSVNITLIIGKDYFG